MGQEQLNQGVQLSHDQTLDHHKILAVSTRSEIRSPSYLRSTDRMVGRLGRKTLLFYRVFNRYRTYRRGDLSGPFLSPNRLDKSPQNSAGGLRVGMKRNLPFALSPRFPIR
ncbi:MAG: hypothetical protein Ct9H300mP19_05100 [Dehalococcoidia bacterium]|nr:MAG: hypothetical protein Ct9H300mP19_05100 [Dehalococcoidia bacterium]